MTDQLHQLNINYVPVEDRLMLRVNTQGGDEFRIWLTRRYTSLLLDLLTKEIDKFGGIPALASTSETRELFKKGAMEKRYEEDHITNYPLGENGILAVKINYKRNQEDNLILELLPEKGKGITLNLNKTLLFMFYNLLTQGCDSSSWGIMNHAAPETNVH